MLYLAPLQMIEAFWQAPPESLHDEKVIGHVLGFTDAWCQRSRWAGQGPPFVKIGRNVRYRKSDVVEWIGSQKRVSATEPATPRSAESARRRDTTFAAQEE